jgi:hypothetical protein
MSMLLGPLSETISIVSLRDCALAEEMTDGPETAAVAANAVADLRKSRRFMTNLPMELSGYPQRSCQIRAVPDFEVNALNFIDKIQMMPFSAGGKSLGYCIQ